VQLDIRTVEFEVLFGRKPFLDFSFMRDLEKRKGTLKDPALYLKLPR
jgi:hypothetical protein